MLRPVSLRSRILAWYGGTLLGVLGVALALLHVQVKEEANRSVAARMNTTRRVVERLQGERITNLAIAARLAGEEPRLASAMTSHHPATIGDLLQRDLKGGLMADFARVTDAEGIALADTTGRISPFTDLSLDPGVRAARAGRVWRGLMVLPHEIYLVATAPIRVGGQDLGTVTVGRRVTDALAGQFRQDTGSEVTFFAGAQLAASSWSGPARQDVLAALKSIPEVAPAPDGSRSFSMLIREQRLMGLLIPLYGADGTRGLLLIQSSLEAALQPYENIQRALAVVGLLGLLVAVAGSVIVAGGVTGPLHRIAHAAQGLMQGDWSQRAPVSSPDEVGLLGETFNRMAERLERWDSDMRTAVAERTRELDAAVARLDAAFQQMRQFNADASHELRTPLTVIRGEAEVALRAQRSPAEYEAVLRSVQEETERMSRIIEQLLLLARADSGELALTRRPIALDDLVREVAHRAEVLARARGIRLRAEALAPTLVEGDEDRLYQLVLNLIDNAIKYTPEGGEVRVRLTCVFSENGIHRDGQDRQDSTGQQTDEATGRGGEVPCPPISSSANPVHPVHPCKMSSHPGEAVLEVEDTGIGIDPAHLPRIFDRFYRVDKARSRAQGGSGLGLSICRWIVEAHGGTIEVQSQPDTGTTFRVWLPGATAPTLEGSHPDFIPA